MISVRVVVPTFDQALNNRRHFNAALDDCDLYGDKREIQLAFVSLCTHDDQLKT